MKSLMSSSATLAPPRHCHVNNVVDAMSIAKSPAATSANEVACHFTTTSVMPSVVTWNSLDYNLWFTGS
ncbi:hypothetical protein LIER_31563 [Lithospermum erythrorhizon]|uniref:Uncharacterized protein n=1 Tax=Lithospermum erythrorhizon TaxID=34254 RepID=A0AAV3RUH3_LITER